MGRYYPALPLWQSYAESRSNLQTHSWLPPIRCAIAISSTTTVIPFLTRDCSTIEVCDLSSSSTGVCNPSWRRQGGLWLIQVIKDKIVHFLTFLFATPSPLALSTYPSQVLLQHHSSSHWILNPHAQCIARLFVGVMSFFVQTSKAFAKSFISFQGVSLMEILYPMSTFRF